MRRALIVGIDDYPSAPLDGCVSDATEVERLLRTNEDGSPNFDTRLMTAPAEVITRPSLRRAVEELFATEADVALLYFSGHGTENNLGGYLVTPDATSYDDGVAMGDVLTLASQSPVREAVVVLDCCNSGAFGRLPVVNNNASYLREGLAVLTASRSNEVAMESGGAGVFTSLLCGALDGGAADVLGTVSVGGAYAYVSQALGAWQQRPLFMAHVSHLVPLRTCRSVVPVAILRRLPEWFPNGHATMALDPSYEPTVEPRDPEHEAVFAQLQRCRAAELVEPVGEDHLYFAAMNHGACRLTPLGRFYRDLAASGRI